jgi:hypothetical protein
VKHCYPTVVVLLLAPRTMDAPGRRQWEHAGKFSEPVASPNKKYFAVTRKICPSPKSYCDAVVDAWMSRNADFWNMPVSVNFVEEYAVLPKSNHCS